MKCINKLVVIGICIMFFISCNSNKKNIDKNACTTDFNVFFERFGKDSVFQKEHIKYPLKELYTEGLESTKIKVNNIASASKHSYMDFTKDKNAMNNQYGKYTIEIEKINKKTIYYKNIGYDNGIHVVYKFKLIEGCWFLVEIVDKSA